MTGIAHAFNDLVSSIMSVFQGILNTLLSMLESVAALFGTSVEALLNLIKSIFAFILSNIVLIGIAAVAFFGYAKYQQSQGNTVKVGNKKIN